MSLRLLPALTMDNDEDDDGNFTKWMSSYWGHGSEGGHSRDRKRSFRRPSRATQGDRRGSLPTVTQLDAMKLNKLHAATMAPSPSHVRSREDWSDASSLRHHPRARRTSSDDTGRPKTSLPETRICTIPEITESLDKRLRTLSLSDGSRLCLICHEAMKKSGASVQELHCTHRFHKECMEQWLWRRQSCPACRVHVSLAKPLHWSSSRTSVP